MDGGHATCKAVRGITKHHAESPFAFLNQSAGQRLELNSFIVLNYNYTPKLTSSAWAKLTALLFSYRPTDRLLSVTSTGVKPSGLADLAQTLTRAKCTSYIHDLERFRMKHLKYDFGVRILGAWVRNPT